MSAAAGHIEVVALEGGSPTSTAVTMIPSTGRLGTLAGSGTLVDLDLVVASACTVTGHYHY